MFYALWSFSILSVGNKYPWPCRSNENCFLWFFFLVLPQAQIISSLMLWLILMWKFTLDIFAGLALFVSPLVLHLANSNFPDVPELSTPSPDLRLPKSFWVLPPYVVLWELLLTIGWNNGWSNYVCFPLLGIIVLQCLFSNFWRLFHVSCLVFSCLR